MSEQEIRNLFDNLKIKFGRDIFGQGFIYRIIAKNELANLQALSEDEKKNGIKGIKVFVPYDKGDKDGNQWYFNDVKIDNATQKTIVPTKSGNYTVKVISPCASEISKPYNVVVTAAEETILEQVLVAPNPFTNRLKVSFSADFGKTAQMKIMDMTGNIHFKKASVVDGELIDLSHLNGGNYILQLESNDNSNTKALKISKIQ
jgi:hypothetical protein